MSRIWLLLLVACSLFAQRRVVIDNELVRVVDVTDSGKEKTPLHEHPMNRVMIYLTEGKQQVEYANGQKKLIEFKPGMVSWSPSGGMHTSQILAGPCRVIEVELKNTPGAPPAALALDPVKVAPANYRIEINEPQVRVIRAHIDGKNQVPMHEHGPNRVVVFLTDTNVRVTDSAGAVNELKAEPGTVRWSAASKHREENLSDKRFEVIAVELK